MSKRMPKLTPPRSRSVAMVSDLLPDPPPSAPSSSVPQWLVDKQQEHIRTAGQNEPPPQKDTPKQTSIIKSANPPNISDSTDKSSETGIPVEEDYIMVDLLDGAHEHTQNSPGFKPSSSNLDNASKLQSIDGGGRRREPGETRDAQRERRMRRGGGGSLSDFNMPPHPSKSTSGKRPMSPSKPLKSPIPDLKHSFPSRVETFLNRDEIPHTAITLPSSMPVGRDSTADKVGLPLVPNRRDLKTAEKTRENTPLLKNDVCVALPGSSKKPPRTRDGSFSIARDFLMLDDNSSIGNSTSTTHSKERRRNEKRKGSRRHHRRHPANAFQPSAWGWRMPAEEDAVMPSGAWVYLSLIGLLTFVIAYLVNDSSAWIGQSIITPLATAIGTHMGGSYSTVAVLAILRGLSLATSFAVVLFIAPDYAAGSGIPEMKCVLSGVLMPRMLNWRTLVAKMIGLVFALASDISIGRLGPFIHMSGITAALVAKIKWFKTLHSSARFQLQALSAAMAAGVGATFGAPIGGTMLSIEVMSTYYYIHWLPMAMYCSVMGYYFVISFVEVDSHAFFTTTVQIQVQVESIRRLFTYIILGAICGVVGAALVKFTKYVFKMRRKYFTNATPWRTGIMVALFAACHTVITTWSGGIVSVSQKGGVEALFNMRDASEVWMQKFWQPFTVDSWNDAVFLTFQMAMKFVLTAMSIVMPVPAGVFMPIFEIGALLGRTFGEVCNGFGFVDWVDPRATAIIGAAALTSGTLHTTSIAVVMLELTREAIDILPLAVGVLVSYGVSKQLCSDLFSELIKIRRLPFILGLRERYPSENKRFYETVSSLEAGSFMSTDFPYVTPTTTKGELYNLLTRGGKPWINCAFLSDKENRRLWGTVSQKSLWDAVGDDVIGHSPGESDEETGYGAVGRDMRWTRTQNDPIPFLHNFDPSVGSADVDMGPMQVSAHTPFWKVITFFRMLSMSTMYVMDNGVTVGCVSKSQVISESINIEENAKKKRKQDKKAEARRKRGEQDMLQQLRRDPQTSTRLASRVSDKDLLNLAADPSLTGRRSRHGSRQGSRQGGFGVSRGSFVE